MPCVDLRVLTCKILFFRNFSTFRAFTYGDTHFHFILAVRLRNVRHTYRTLASRYNAYLHMYILTVYMHIEVIHADIATFAVVNNSLTSLKEQFP